MNPKTVDRRRNAAGVKTDAVDAYLLGQTGRADLADLRQLHPDMPVVAELKLLTRDQDGLIQSQRRLVNQLTACLKTSSPVALTVFCKLHQRSTLALLQMYPTPEAAMAAWASEIETLLRNALYQLAWQSTLEEPWALAYYQRKRAEGKSHTVAVRALANVWVRIIYTHSCYERATFEAAQRAHAKLVA